MSKREIEIVDCVSGDWSVLKVDGKIYAEGHKINDDNWIALIRNLTGIKIIETTISDEDMEEGNY